MAGRIWSIIRAGARRAKVRSCAFLSVPLEFIRSCLRAKSAAKSPPSRQLLGSLAVVLVLVLAVADTCRAQNRDVLCNYGTGNFYAEFRSGVSVRVEVARNGELAARLCRAVLSWQNQKLVIADQVLQVDVDALGADIGLGTPVITFQVKKSQDCCVDYEIYSLQKPPSLLRTIIGGDFFSAADTDLDGEVEIWPMMRRRSTSLTVWRWARWTLRHP